MTSTAISRLRALLLAQSRGERRGSWIEVGTAHLLVALLLCGLARGQVAESAYAWLSLALSALLLLGPLLGDLAAPLRRLALEEWLRSLPARPLELRLARCLAYSRGVVILATFSLLPAAVLAPGPGWSAGLGLLLLGYAQALLLGTAVAAVQSLLAGRLEALLVLLQSALLMGVFATLLALPRLLAWLGPLGSPGELPLWAQWLPPSLAVAWTYPAGAQAPVAANVALLLLLALAGSLLAAWLPAPPAPSSGSGSRPLDWLLKPLAQALRRWWVRPPERASYDLVRRALPREREVTLRALPLLALPLVFAAVAVTREPGDERDGLLSLLLFAPGFYLPILQLHVAASQSAQARHLLELAPTERCALERGAQKALVATYLLPISLALFLLAGALSDWAMALRLAPLGCLAGLLCLRVLYPRTVVDLPLSRPIEQIGCTESLAGPLITAGISLAGLALLARFGLTELWQHAALLMALIALERWSDRPAVATGS